MTVVRKFLRAELIWAAAIFLLVLPLNLESSHAHGFDMLQYLRWLVRALALATFPAGVIIAPDVFAQPRRWRAVITVLGVAAALGVLLFAFTIGPLFSADGMTVPRLIQQMTTESESWETRNHAAWTLFNALFVVVQSILFAAIGVQVGIWATYAVPPVLRRLLYWVVGLGLVISGYNLSDSTYEVVVLHTAANVDFAAFYTLLIPLGICAGLALPTLALLRGAEVRGSDH